MYCTPVYAFYFILLFFSLNAATFLIKLLLNPNAGHPLLIILSRTLKEFGLKCIECCLFQEVTGDLQFDEVLWFLTILQNLCFQEVNDFTSLFIAKDYLESQPLKGLRVGVIRETLGDGVDQEVVSSIRGAISHLEELGSTVTEVVIMLFILKSTRLS